MSEGRTLRADARRNRARILAVAEDAFGAEGIGVPIEELARRAGVGVGTFYRHFPDKEALLGALITERIEQLITAAEAALDGDPLEGFGSFLAVLVRAGSGNKAIAGALRRSGVDLQAVVGEPGRRLAEVQAALLRRAQQAGAIRPDVGPRELKVLTNGLIQAAETYPDDPGMAGRLLPVVLAGLRNPEPGSVPDRPVR